MNVKRVLVRCDFNVPLDEKGNILDDFRIKSVLPTLNYLIEKQARTILMSHLGRPAQTPKPKIQNPNLKMDQVQNRLMEYLDLSIAKASDCVGPEIEKWTYEMQSGEILLLENLRFHPQEKENDESFAKELSKLGDLYVNDAFGASHRAHASIVGVPKFLPACAGFLLEKEIDCLSRLSHNPQKPLVAVIGGKKVDDKARVIDKISEMADFVLVGGLIQKEIDEKDIRFKYPEKIIGPVDEAGGGRDIGPETLKLFGEKVLSAKTIFWNGPLGEIEEKEFSKGTEKLAQIIIESGAYSVVGGGETVEFINQLGLAEKFSHVSTGGGALLKFLAGEVLPGLAALNRK